VVKTWSQGGRPKLTVDDMKEIKSMLILEAAHISCTPEDLEAELGNMQLNKLEQRHGWAAATVQRLSR
jgi:hypothetical protein